MDVQQRAVMHLVEMAKGWWIGRWSVCSLDERPITNVGGAVRRFDLLPIAVDQSAYVWLTRRNREQAPLPHVERRCSVRTRDASSNAH